MAIACLFFSSIWPLSARAQRDSARLQKSSPGLEQAVSAAGAKYKIPGMAVAFLRRGQPADIAVFGTRSGAAGASVTRSTIFQVAGLGEPVFAYAVLALAAEGKFDAGAPLTKYLPLPYRRELDALAPSSGTEPIYDPRLNQITGLRILNHTSGMPDWVRNSHLRLLYPPGQQWSYSNEGYIYLQDVLEAVTGESLGTIVASGVLDPFGLGHSSFVWRNDYSTDMATGHTAAGAAVPPEHYARPAAATTLYTTIDDYARFVTMLLTSSPSLKTHESVVSLMANPSVAVDNSFSFFWGLGCGVEKSGEDLYFFERGATNGFDSFFMASRKTGTAVVILTNSENGSNAFADIVAATIGGNHPVLKSPFLQGRTASSGVVTGIPR